MMAWVAILASVVLCAYFVGYATGSQPARRCGYRPVLWLEATSSHTPERLNPLLLRRFRHALPPSTDKGEG